MHTVIMLQWFHSAWYGSALLFRLFITAHNQSTLRPGHFDWLLMFLTPQANFWRHSIINIQNLFILLDSHLLKIVLSCPQGLLKNNKHLLQKNTSWLEFPISSFHFSDSTSLDVYMATTYTNYTLIWMHSSTMSLGRGSWIISYYITCFLLVYLTFISIKSTTRTMLKSCLVQIKCLIYVSVHNLYYYYKCSQICCFCLLSPISDFRPWQSLIVFIRRCLIRSSPWQPLVFLLT